MFGDTQKKKRCVAKTQSLRFLLMLACLFSPAIATCDGTGVVLACIGGMRPPSSTATFSKCW